MIPISRIPSSIACCVLLLGLAFGAPACNSPVTAGPPEQEAPPGNQPGNPSDQGQGGGGGPAGTSDAGRIQPYSENPFYWEYNGAPVLLIGGSNQDNLFNHPDLPPAGLEAHLDLLVSVGGNYVRNTMSSRDLPNLWPYRKDPDGRYDLGSWNDEYWERFDDFLRLALDRDVIVQVEIWDRFDFSQDSWEKNPFNPRNNVTYTEVQSGLPSLVSSHPAQRGNPFFRSTPGQDDNPLVLVYQEAFVDKLLSISLPYPNVLYTISNETNESPIWSGYWADFIRERADAEELEVFVSEMWDPWNLADPMHDYSFGDPERYTFLEVSQNSHQVGQTHWDRIQHRRTQLVSAPRPLNSVKIYGGPRHGGSHEEGALKMWRNTFGGVAASRFHRPTAAGIGLNDLAQTHIRSLRMFTDAFHIFSMEPRRDLLTDRAPDEAYAMAEAGRQYAVFFPDGGAVSIDLGEVSGSLTLRWLDILGNGWGPESEVEAGGSLPLEPPGRGPWAALLTR